MLTGRMQTSQGFRGLQQGAADPFTVHFHLVDGFSMMALSSAIEPMRAANRLLQTTRYAWSWSARAQGVAMSSNGIGIPAAHGSADFPDCDLTVVVASLFDPSRRDRKLETHLRRLQARGRMIGSVSNGAWILAQAGIVGDRAVAIHWEMANELKETFPGVRPVGGLYAWDRGILTAGGGTAAMDMMLALIAAQNGEEVASDVADQFLHGPIRASEHGQKNSAQWLFGVTDARLLAAMEKMTGNIARPVAMGEIAASAGLSERQLERLFLSKLGVSPSAHYMKIRLRAAREMLIGSTERLEAIAVACGFSSLGHFSRAFKALYGESPSVVRRKRPHGGGGNLQETVGII